LRRCHHAVIVSAVAGGLFFWRVLSYRQPIVDLRAFLYRNFTLGAFYTFVMGRCEKPFLPPVMRARVRARGQARYAVDRYSDFRPKGFDKSAGSNSN
jgi:hypothetical protein